MLNLVVVYGSLYVGGSLTLHLSRLETVAIVGQSSEVEEAVQMISSKRPHIVILDFELKGGLGLKVLQRTKQLEFPPVVIMTASSSYQQYRRQCLREGADFYFELPDEIEGMVKNLSDLASIFATAGVNMKSEIEKLKKK